MYVKAVVGVWYPDDEILEVEEIQKLVELDADLDDVLSDVISELEVWVFATVSVAPVVRLKRPLLDIRIGDKDGIPDTVNAIAEIDTTVEREILPLFEIDGEEEDDSTVVCDAIIAEIVFTRLDVTLALPLRLIRDDDDIALVIVALSLIYEVVVLLPVESTVELGVCDDNKERLGRVDIDEIADRVDKTLDDDDTILVPLPVTTEVTVIDENGDIV